MSSVHWGNGWVDYAKVDGAVCVAYFENDGVVWYDAQNGVERAGWQEELEPYEGPGAVGLLSKLRGL